VPKSKTAASAGAFALIQYLLQQIEEGERPAVAAENTTVGQWIERFTAIERSPRTARNAAGNRPYSVGTLTNYESYYRNYVKDARITGVKMEDVEEEDVLGFISELSVREFVMELAVCAAIFFGGWRRAEVFALRPECLDWKTPKITIKEAWQNFSSRDRVLSTTKSKREREAPFDPILQGAIKKLWEENGQHEFVFSHKNGKTPGPSGIKGRFVRWLHRAGIDTTGRRIVPHSARHSLASLLEARGVPLRYIQDLLGHSDLKTTKIYLHAPEGAMASISEKISKAMGGAST
jgi:integrase